MADEGCESRRRLSKNVKMNRIIDVFNGDADGLCALHQLRLAEPADSMLVTGPKRDISLLKRVVACPGDRITVLDVALSKNRAAVDAALAAGATVRYFDHHQPGEIPDHPNFEARIDTSPETCTSLLVNEYLGSVQLVWAVTAAFGDNLAQAARLAAAPLGLSEGQLAQLQELGECLNYNGYGETLEDLHYPPDKLYRIVHQYRDPFELIAQEPAFTVLKNGFAADMENANSAKPEIERPGGRIFILPAEKWARRISGVLGNRLAESSPSQAHAVLTGKPGGGFVVSVRAPLANKAGADEICSQFETGGGRKGAAGINHLPLPDFDRFVNLFFTVYKG
jgi:single-stranded DNA-specific DHH superfamily exonuclease